MTEVTIVGLDLTKRVFKAHSATVDGSVAIIPRLPQNPKFFVSDDPEAI
ncbi:MAG: hypothetical protein JJ868_19410 [Shimia sp.]|nr:hypothetical protein [Shimia sp.]